MKTRSTFSLAMILGLGIGVCALSPSLLRAEDPAPVEKKAEEKKPEEKKPAAVKGPRLTSPWSKLTTLTVEQKIKIDEIHKKAVEDKKAIESKEEADITALLTDEQKLELQKMKEDEAAKKKAAAAERMKKDEPKKEEGKTEEKAEEKKDGM